MIDSDYPFNLLEIHGCTSDLKWRSVKQNQNTTNKIAFKTSLGCWTTVLTRLGDHTSSGRGSRCIIFKTKLLIMCGASIICGHRDGCLQEQHPQTLATQVQARLVDATVDSLAVAPWHHVTGLWKTSLPDPIICTEAFSSSTLCIMMFHWLSNRVTIWNILRKCRCDMSDNFQFSSKCTTIYIICRCSAPVLLTTLSPFVWWIGCHILSVRCFFHVTDVSLLLTASHAFPPRFWLDGCFQLPHKYNPTVPLNHR